MQKGNIGVTTENIFPVIKKFLYSDHEIFLREMVSNAVDATQKMKTLQEKGDFKGDLGDLTVRVNFDADKGTITISDHGIGMTEEEIDKYINQIAFSGVTDFLEKYKDNANNIIGHFGLGFYSSFMVSKKVEIITKSWKEGAKAVKWSCDGSPAYEIDDAEREDRGSDIILYIDDDCKEFLDKYKLEGLLQKYCKFMAVPIAFGKKQEWSKEESKMVDTAEDNIINNVEPLWTKTPSTLKDEDYKSFYRTLYPMSDEPLFWIHLNVDYPFNLTGILYFPKIKSNIELQKNKIQLYCNQVFVTDQVEGVVPDYLMLLHGVLDSPDIPLNVSRSYLQSDGNVKKISQHISKKVADKLEEMSKKKEGEEKSALEDKWDDIKIFVQYGMLTDEKFCERAMKFYLLKGVDGTYYTLDSYREKIAALQTDKDKTVCYLYASNSDEEHAYIEKAKAKGYNVLLMDSPLESHFINLLEQKIEKTRFVRVDSDTVEKLIPHDDSIPEKLSKEEKEKLQPIIEGEIDKQRFTVQLESLEESDAPMQVTQSEFMRRYREMAQTSGGGMGFYGELPESYNLVVNINHPLISRLLNETDNEKQKELVHQLTDLALLGNGLLKGEALSRFLKRSVEMI